MAPMSNNPKEAVEGGDFPRGNLLITGAKFAVHNYIDKGGKAIMDRSGKPAKTMAALLDLRNDFGDTFTQVYSVGDSSRYEVLDGGNQLGGELRQGSNWYAFVLELLNKGYPENKFTDDITDFVGLYAFWDTIEQKKRVGLDQRAGAVLVVPTELYQFPWGEAAKRGAPKPPALAKDEGTGSGREGGVVSTVSNTSTSTPRGRGGARTSTRPSAGASRTAAPAPENSELMGVLVQFVQEMLDDQDSEHRREDLTQLVFNQADPKNKLALMSLMMKSELVDALEEEGIVMEGEKYVRKA